MEHINNTKLSLYEEKSYTFYGVDNGVRVVKCLVSY